MHQKLVKPLNYSSCEQCVCVCLHLCVYGAHTQKSVVWYGLAGVGKCG